MSWQIQKDVKSKKHEIASALTLAGVQDDRKKGHVTNLRVNSADVKSINIYRTMVSTRAGQIRDDE